VKNQIPHSWILLFIGVAVGIWVLGLGTSAKAEEIKISNIKIELALYITALVLIFLSFTTKIVWLQVLSFAVSDFIGSVLSIRVVGFLEKFHLKPFLFDVVSGTICFTPALLSAIILLSTMRILPFVGPATGIASAAFAIPGSYFAFKGSIDIKRVFWLLFFGTISIVSLYLAYI
jgi:hypothetical protein